MASFKDEENKQLAALDNEDKIMRYVKLGLSVFGIIAMLFAIRGIFKKLGIDEFIRRQRELLLFDSHDEALENSEEKREEMRKKRQIEESRSKQEFQEKVTAEVNEFTKNEAEQAGRILRYWMVEDE